MKVDWTTVVPFLIWAAAFLIGSIPFGVIVARAFGVSNLREKGSGNIGATNVSRVLGFWPAGAITFALDLGKGALPVFLVGSPHTREMWKQLENALSADVIGPDGFSMSLVWIVGFLAVLGHCYTPWLRLRGGKGVATGFGVFLVLSPPAAVAGLAAFGLSFAGRKLGSLASLVGVMVGSATHLVLNPVGVHLWAGAALVFLILLRHEENIDALLEDRERSLA